MSRRRSSSPSDGFVYSLILLFLGGIIGTAFTLIAPTVGMQILGPSPPWYYQVTFYGLLLLIFGSLALIVYLLGRLARETHQSHDELRSSTEELHKPLRSNIEELQSLLRSSVEELRSRIGITIEYVYADPKHGGRRIVYSKAREVVEKAKKQILVLTLINEGDKSKDDEETQREIDKYYEALLERVTKGHVIYRRIVQIPDKKTLKDLVPDTDYRQHFHRMLDIQEGNPTLINLQKAPVRRQTTFVLIDGTHLIWQINERLDSGEWQMHGIFIIEDPRREITQYFETFFDTMRKKIDIERDDLPERNDLSSHSH
jgi:hypothetical protein